MSRAARVRPHGRLWSPLVLAILTSMLVGASSARAQETIPLAGGFRLEPFTTAPLSEPVKVAFAPDGRAFVLEKEGRVRIVQDGEVLPTPFLDLTDEVLYSGDRGLLGLALDPNFAVNGYVYLLYTVDFGDPDVRDADRFDVFNRLIRVSASAGNPNVADPASRFTLIGNSFADGIPACFFSHTGNSLQFGSDGTLLVSVGDGANYVTVDGGGLYPDCFGPDRFPEAEDIGAFRSQVLTSLAGKILRIDPSTGLGLSSNPFYTGDPAAAASKVWARGFRNPYRFAIRPDGAADPAAGNPGTVFLGEVGWFRYEEVNVVRGGENFGWPCRTGPIEMNDYASNAPDEFARFCTGQTFTDPAVYFNHEDPNLSSPPGLGANALIGGDFLAGDRYPESYRGRFTYADAARGWLAASRFDEAGALVEQTILGENVGFLVDLTFDPVNRYLHVVNIADGLVYRLRHESEDVGSGGLPEGWQTTDVGGATTSGRATYDAGRFALTGSLAPLEAPDDAGRFVYQPLSGDGTIVARLDEVGPGAGAGLALRADASAEGQRVVLLVEGDRVTLRSGAGPELTEAAAAATTAPRWLRLQREGPAVTASVSTDGLTWQFVGTVALVLPESSLGGLLALAGREAVSATVASFSEASVQALVLGPGGLPQPWASRDIGAVAIEGSARFNAGQFTVQGAGDAWGEADAFHYAYRPFTGNGRIATRLFRQAAPRPWAKSGVMFRADLGEASEHVSFYYASERGYHLQYRDARGALTSSFFAAEGTPPGWLELRRSGPLFVASVSDDGQTWREVGSVDVDMGETLYVGLASTATDIERVGDICIAIFDNVVVEEQPPLPGPLPWIETFALPDGTNADTGETAWSLDLEAAAPTALAEVRDDALVLGPTASTEQPTGAIVWRAEALDLAGFDAAVLSVTVRTEGDLGATDTLQVRYTLDGRPMLARTLVGVVTGGDPLVLSTDTLRGATVQAEVRAIVGSAGRYVVDQVALATTPTGAPPPVGGIPRFLLQTVYPNPFQDAAQIEIAFDQPGAYRFEVFDMLGRQVFVERRREESASVVTVPFRLPEGAAGTYIVRVLHEPTGAAVHTRVTRLRP
ncbi:MAG: PQQ-dependent sugar dehydrogenase [Bacteroidota bacterium]